MSAKTIEGYTDQITVGELVEQLRRFDPNLLVQAEGCDCYGEAGAAVEQSGYVLVERIKPVPEDD